LRVVHAGTNEELDVIAESMDLIWGQTCAFEMHNLRVEEGAGDGSERVHPLTRVQRLNDALIAGTRADGSELTAQRGSLPARWSGPKPRATDRPDPPLVCGPGPRLW